MVNKNKKNKYLIVGLIISFTVLLAWLASYNKICVTVDDKKLEYWTQADTVEEVIHELEFEINKNDVVQPSLSTSLDNTETIEIRRGFEVQLKYNGKEQTIITTASNVAELIKANKITLGPLDLVNPDLTTKISLGLIISIVKVEEDKLTITEEIPYEKKYQDDKNLLNGQKRIIQKGKAGTLSKTFLVTYHDGNEQKRELVEEEIIKEPVSEITAVGTKKTVQRAGKDLDFKRALTVKSTAYTHTGNKTSTGNWPKRGTVAVDPKVISIGSKLYIDGYGYGVAEDIGGSVKGERIDLFMETKNEAVKWGTKTVRVYILN